MSFQSVFAESTVVASVYDGPALWLGDRFYSGGQAPLPPPATGAGAVESVYTLAT